MVLGFINQYSNLKNDLSFQLQASILLSKVTWHSKLIWYEFSCWPLAFTEPVYKKFLFRFLS